MLARFLRDRRGSIAPLFAIAAIPIIGGVGAAVDYSRATATKAAFQSALDSTALMLSKNAATQSAADLQASATTYFNALFNARLASQEPRPDHLLLLHRRLQGRAQR